MILKKIPSSWWIMQFFGKLWKLWENIEVSSLQQPIQERIIYYMSQTIVQQKLFWDNLLALKLKEHRYSWINQCI